MATVISRAQRLAASVVWQVGSNRPWGQPGSVPQRLAASVVLAGKHPQSVLIALPQCSTPCGISGLAGTKELLYPVRHIAVLNALRHQWFGRWVTLRPAHPPHCAQRLAASVVWAGRPEHEKPLAL